MPRTSPVHYVLPSAISITPNANESAEDLAVYVAKGTKIKVYSQGLPSLGFEDGTFKEWTFAGRNRRLAYSNNPYTIYARLAKEDKSDGYLVFAPKIWEDGIWKHKYPYVTWTGLAKNTATATPEITAATNKYWFIKLGDVSLPENGERTLDYDTGILGTDQFNSEWNLDPDDMPLRIEIECSIEGEDAGPTPYVPWGKELILRAKLVEGWADTDVERFDHWTILRNTGDEIADVGWPPAGRALGFGRTGNIALNHSRTDSDDDFNGAVSTTFTVIAWGTEHDESSSSDLGSSSSSSDISSSSDSSEGFVDSSSSEADGQSAAEIVPIATATITIMAETVEKYELELSSSIVSYDPTTDAYSPTDGIKARIRATDQKGTVFKLTRGQLNAAGLVVQYALTETEEWNTLTFANASTDIAETTIPISAFLAQQNINVRICKIVNASISDSSDSSSSSESSSSSDIEPTLVEIYRTPIAFVRNGEDSREREWIYLRSEKAIAFIGDDDSSDSSDDSGIAQEGHLVPKLIPAGEVNPLGAAAGIDTNKNQDGWVPEGWFDEMQGTDETYHYEYGSYRDWIRQESASSGSSSGESADSGDPERRVGCWGEFSKPTIWSYRAEDAVTYRCRWTLAGNVVYQLIASYTGAFRGTLPLVATLMKRKGSSPEEVATATATIITVSCEGLPYHITVNAQNPQFTISETVNPEFVSYLNNMALTGLTITFTIDGEEHTFSIPVIRDADEDTIKNSIAGYGEELFISKVHDDVAAGMVRFINEKGAQFGEDFASGPTGFGGRIDGYADAELNSLTLRRFLEVPELRYNRISIQVGNRWRAPGGGIIKKVTVNPDGSGENTGVIELHLEEGEIGKVAVGDICMGVFHDGMTLSNNDADDFDDSRGNFRFSGFYTTYFWITQVTTDKTPNDTIRYELRPSTDPQKPYKHPSDMMHFVCYGSFSDVTRQQSRYSTLTYERYLRGVNDWEFTKQNIAAQFGDLSNLNVYGLNMRGYSAYLDNIYMSGTLEQINTIVDQLSSYQVDFSDYVDVVTVDDVGNVIGGLYKVNNNVPYDYRIYSAISVRKNNQLLTVCGANETVGPGKFKIYAEPVRCTYALNNSTIYITSIANIKDGIPGTADDVNFDYSAMRDMQNCYVNLTIDCEGVTSIIKQFPVTIKHQSEPFVGADISNEFSSVSWNTRTQAYIGLPVVFDFKMWHNNEMLNIVNAANVSLVSATPGVTLVNLSSDSSDSDSSDLGSLAPSSIYYTKSIITVSGKKYARIQLTAMGTDVPPVVDIDVTCTATYSGVSYERTLRHTVNKSTDTNVYQLLTDPAEVCAGYNANQQKVLNTNNITCSVRCDSTDDKHYTVAVADYPTHGLFITTQKFTMNAQNQEVPGAEEAYSTVSGVTVSTDNTRVRFKLYKLADTTLSNLSALLASSNVLEVLDVEDVPVVLDGLDGENSIQVVLDNDSDNVTCTEDGTVIAATLSVVHACLMDGEDAIGSSGLGSTRSADKQKFGTFSSGTLTQGWEIECTNCTAEIANAWTTIEGKPWITIDLKTVTDDTASINVKCLYTKHGQNAYYSRLFTVSKLYGIDKHEIILNPNSICYKANDDSYTPTNFSVYIYKTTQEEDRHLMATLPSHSPAQHGDYSLQYSLDKGVNWSNISGYSNGAVIRESSDQGSGNKFSWDDADSIEIRLRQYFVENGVGTWILLDQECEDIVADGQDGKGVEYIFFTQESWIEDNPNGMATPTIRDEHTYQGFQEDNHCPYNVGATQQWTDEPTGVSGNVGYKYEFYAQRKKVNGVWQNFGTVHLWNKYTESGSSPYILDLSNDNSFINCDDSGTVIGSYETTDIIVVEGGRDAFDDFNYTVTGHNITATRSGRTITPSNIQAISATIVVEATLKTNANFKLTAVYSINKSFPGNSTVIYSLLPSVNMFHKLGDNGNFTEQTFSAQVKKSAGTDTSLISLPADMSTEGLALTYAKDAGSESSLTGSMNGIPVSTLLSGVQQYITLFLRGTGANSNKLYDRERIYIVKDGDTGADFTYDDFTAEQLAALRGPSGCHERVYQQYIHDNTFYYHNDEDDDTIQGIRYVDFMCVEDSTMASGYKVYKCKVTHPASATTFALDEANWEEVSVNVASAYMNYIVARNAHFKFGASNQLAIYNSNNQIVAGLTGDIPDEYDPDSSVRIWAGGDNPSTAPFRVQQDGQFFADKAHIKGLVEIRGTEEGLIVYDNNGNEKVQIVAGEVDEPMNVTGERSPSSGSVEGNNTYSMRPDKYFDLPAITIPITVNGVNGELKAGSVISGAAGGFLHVTVRGNNNIMYLYGDAYAAPERLGYQIELQDSNNNVVWKYIGGISASYASNGLNDVMLGFGNFIVPKTASGYKFVVRMAIDTIYVADGLPSNNWGGLAKEAPVKVEGYMVYNISTPTGTRIGTNGMFVNLASGKSVFISADQTEIKYGNNRIKVDNDGVYGYDGSSYVPLVKKTRSLASGATVNADDGVLFLTNSSEMTLTFNASSSKEVYIISKTGNRCNFTLPSGKVIYDCTGSQASSYNVHDKHARKFIADSNGNYHELYLSN